MLGTSSNTVKAPDLGAIRQELVLALLAGGLAARNTATSAEGAETSRQIESAMSAGGAAIRRGAATRT